MTKPSPGGDGTPAVAAGVILRDGCLLLVRRRVPEGSLTWQFPAGKVEQGESPEDAVVREVKEETGLVVAVTEQLRERIHPGTGVRILYFACAIRSGTAHRAAPDEVADISWVPLRDVFHYVPDGFYLPVQQYLDTTATQPAPRGPCKKG
ncbi:MULTISPECIES: NUDIX hydrolase [Streptomyces]|uniref:NUDIX hydrolase n=1 Tax=Streptomyces tsukubensis (strain DSM 42081 / NBRC 108919 / NRRL 18488 / 9993) TaxID=1114943 RepID=I2N6K8_STRT9|nr:MULTISPECIES: NUDIX hydrolase [Streptomyces]AZK96604.1 NUDIX hydrolase [Streptomyces tsukubensis]EIF92655.1 hydrolase [Streptomyces tsukubensis NRRL18488]MYS67860.1 NUDIX domain-containing protein [Streptomyces sp. SID5473]QKM67394.1 NUDIX hydrolase [Streptomyces tsukubensis NRRL18488]TAI42097.1 NUDIX hydrolase [Streptomyces tsukubensis]